MQATVAMYVLSALFLQVSLAANDAGILYRPSRDAGKESDRIELLLRDVRTREIATAEQNVVFLQESTQPQLFTQDAITELSFPIGGPPECILEKVRLEASDLVTIELSTVHGHISPKPLHTTNYGIQEITAHDGPYMTKNQTFRASAERLNAFLAACGLRYIPPSVPAESKDILSLRLPQSNNVTIWPLRLNAPLPPRLVGCSQPLQLKQGESVPIDVGILGGRGHVANTTSLKVVRGTGILKHQSDSSTDLRFDSLNRMRTALAQASVLYTPDPTFRGIETLTLVLTLDHRSVSEIECLLYAIAVARPPRLLGPLERNSFVDSAEPFVPYLAHEDEHQVPIRGIVVASDNNEEIQVELLLEDQRHVLALDARPTGIRIFTAEARGEWPAKSSAWIRISGPPDAVNRGLDGLTCTPAANFFGRIWIKIHAKYYNEENQGSDSARFAIDVTPLDDPPVITGGSKTLYFDEDTALRFGDTSLLLTDPDAKSDEKLEMNAYSTLPDVTWSLAGYHPNIEYYSNETVRLYGPSHKVQAAFNDLSLKPPQDWHGVFELRLSTSRGSLSETKTQLTLVVQPIVDAPAILLSNEILHIDEDLPTIVGTQTNITIKAPDLKLTPLYESGHGLDLWISARRGSVYLDGEYRAAAEHRVVLKAFAHGEVRLLGWPDDLSALLRSSLGYISEPNAPGPDAIDIVLKSLASDSEDSSTLLVDVLPINDPPRLETFVRQEENEALVLAGSAENDVVLRLVDVDSDDIVSLKLSVVRGRVFVTDKVPEVEYTTKTELDSVQLRGGVPDLNAALASVVWRAYDETSLLLVNATDQENESTSAEIMRMSDDRTMYAVAPPELRGFVPRSVQIMEDDNDWTELAEASVSGNDDDVLELRAVVRPRAKLRVHRIETKAQKWPAIHLISIANTSSSNASTLTSGSFVLQYTMTNGATATTGPIAIDAVAKVSEERRGLSQSLESAVRSLSNIKAARLDVVVSRQNVDANTRSWRISFSGGTPAATNGDFRAYSNDTLIATTSLARRANELGGSFALDVAGACCARVPHNATATDVERALTGLSTVDAAAVSRGAESAQGGFAWDITFLAAAGHSQRAMPIAVDVTNLTGGTSQVVETVLSSTRGLPAVWKVETTAKPEASIHAVTLDADGPGFIQIGLDTRNCSMRSGSADFAANGTMRWTDPIPRGAVAGISDEQAVHTVTPTDPNISLGYSPHSISVEARVLALKNWIDLGDNAALTVSRHERRARVTWRLTFTNAPHALPLVRVRALTPADTPWTNEDSEDEDAWAASNTSVTRHESYAHSAAAKARVDASGFAASALELDAIPLGGAFRLGLDGHWTDEFPVGVDASALRIALSALPSLSAPAPDRAAELLVSRDGPDLVGGYRYWIVFLREPYESNSAVLLGDAKALRGPESKQLNAKLLLPSESAGALRISRSRTHSLAWLSGNYNGDERIMMSGSATALNEVAETLAFRPAPNFNGIVSFDLSIIDPAGQQAIAGFDFEVEAVNDAPYLTWKNQDLDLDGGYSSTDGFAVRLDEDTEARISELRLVDIDAGPNETFSLSIRPKYGVVSTHRAPPDPRRIARNVAQGKQNSTWLPLAGLNEAESIPLIPARFQGANSFETGELLLVGALLEINKALETLTYVGSPEWHGLDALSMIASDQTGSKSEERQLIIQVDPVNDFPVWVIDDIEQLYQQSAALGHAPVAGRGRRLLVDHTHKSGYAPEDHGARNAPSLSESTNANTTGVLLAARFILEDGGATTLGGISVYDPDVGALYSLPNDTRSSNIDLQPPFLLNYSKDVAWPAHLEIDAKVEHGLLSIARDGIVGVAEVLAAARSSGNVQVVSGNATFGSSRLVLRGHVSALQDVLAALAYAPNPNWNGVDILEMVATDGGDAAYGSGGRHQATAAVAIDVAAVPDAPKVQLPPSLIRPALEDVPFIFGKLVDENEHASIEPFAISDADYIDQRLLPRRWLIPYTAGNATPRYTTNAEDGTMSAIPGVSHLLHGQSVDGYDVAGMRDDPLDNSYTLTISARHGWLVLSNGLEPQLSTPLSTQTLRNYTLAELNRALFGMKYISHQNWNSEAHAKQIADTVADHGILHDDGPLESINLDVTDGTGESSTSNFVFRVAAVNDAPVLDSLLLQVVDAEKAETDSLSRLTRTSGTTKVLEDSTSNFDLIVRDVDASDIEGGVIEISALAAHGIFDFSSVVDLSGVSLTAGVRGERLLTFAADPTTAASVLSAMEYTPDANFAGTDSVYLSVTDQGNSGIGGELTDSLQIKVQVEPECDAPTVQPLPSVIVTTREDRSITLGFDIDDVDHTNLAREYAVKEAAGMVNASESTTYFPLVHVKVTAGNGSLSINIGSLDDVVFDLGSSGAAEAAIGFHATLKSAKEAVRTMTYVPRRDFYTNPRQISMAPVDQVQLVISDLGLDGGGLSDPSKCKPLIGHGMIMVQIDAVNDAPNIQVPGAVYRIAADTSEKASEAAVRGDLQLLHVRPQYVDEDEELNLGKLLDIIDDSSAVSAFPEALGALSVAVENGEFAFTSNLVKMAYPLNVEDGPIISTQVISSANVTQSILTSENNLLLEKPFIWKRGAIRWLLRPTDARAVLKSLRFRSKPFAWGNASLTVAYEDGGYGGIETPTGVPGCYFCIPHDVTSSIAQSTYDLKKIPIIIEPVVNTPRIISPFSSGASAIVPEDTGGWLDGVSIFDPDDPDAYMVIRLSVDRGHVSLREPPPEALTFTVGDGDMDQYIVASGPLSAINTALSGLRYSPEADFTYVNSGGAFDYLHIFVEDHADNNVPLTSSATISLRVEPTSDDSPMLIVENSTRVTSPCPTQEQAAMQIKCNQELAIATRSGFLEDVPRVDFAGVVLQDVDESEHTRPQLLLELSVAQGYLSFGSAAFALGLDFIAGSALSNSERQIGIRASIKILNEAIKALTYVGQQDWHGVDVLNLTVTDSSGGRDFASIILIVDPVIDDPFLELQIDQDISNPLFRPSTSVIGPKTSWRRAADAAATTYNTIETLEDTKMRLPPMRIRDLDAEANAISIVNASSGSHSIAAAIQEAASGQPDGVSRKLHLLLRCEHGKIQLCALNCPGVDFIESETGMDTRLDGDVEFRPSSQRWWSSAHLEGTALALSRALLDWHYWPNLNYNSDAYQATDESIHVVVFKETGNKTTHTSPIDEVAVRIAVRAVNDAPVVRAEPLEILYNSSTPLTTGDGLSPKVSGTADDILVTDEDTSLNLTNLFTIRDVDVGDMALPGDGMSGGTVEVRVNVVHGKVSIPVADELVSSVLFVEPSVWSNATNSSQVHFIASVATANLLVGGLVFIPARDWHGSTSEVRVTCSDRGNFGLGGVKIGTQRVVIRVLSVNDKPTVIGPNTENIASFFIDEGETLRLLGTNFEDAYMAHLRRAGDVQAMDEYFLSDTLDKVVPYVLNRPEAHEEYGLWRSGVSKPSEDILDNAYYTTMEADPEFGWQHVAVYHNASRHTALSPSYFAEFGGNLYFSAHDHSSYGTELWRTDGVTVSLVSDILPGPESSSPQHLTTYNDKLYFGAVGVDDRSWRIPLEHADECDGMRQSSFESRVFFVVSEENIWNPGQSYDCPRDYHWMKTAEAIELFTGSNIGASTGDGGNFLYDANFDEMTYFGQCGWFGYEWGSKSRQHFRFADSHLTGAYKSAASPDARRPDMDPIRNGEVTLRLNKFAGVVCVLDDPESSVSATGSELWVSDGSSSGTIRAAEINAGGSHSHANVSYLTVFDGALFFSADDGIHGAEPHRFVADDDRGRGTARLLSDIRRGPEASRPRYFSGCGGLLWFAANDGLHGEELFVSTGALGFLDRETGDAAHLASFPEIGGSETWMANDLAFGRASSSPAFLTCLGDSTLLFAATEARTGRELWRASFNKTIVVERVRDISRGARSSNPNYLTLFQGRVYFTADDGEHGIELWSTDGTASGTKLIADVRAGVASSSPRLLTPFGSRLYFVAKQDAGRSTLVPRATQLWSTDGSTTSKVFDHTEALFDVDFKALDAAWPPQLGILGKEALFFPARRGGTPVVGGVARGYARGAGVLQSTQAFAVYDADHYDELSLRLSVAPQEAGTITLSELAGARIVQGDGSADTDLILRGSMIQVNNALRNLIFSAEPTFNGLADINAAISDSCEGYRNLTCNDSMRAVSSIFVRQINEAPTILLKSPQKLQGGATEMTMRDIPIIYFSDPDLNETSFGIDPASGKTIAPRVLVNITTVYGRISLAHISGLAFLQGDGVSDQVHIFEATIEDANRAVASLHYSTSAASSPASSSSSDIDYIYVSVDDNGYSGAGGPKKATGLLTITN